MRAKLEKHNLISIEAETDDEKAILEHWSEIGMEIRRSGSRADNFASHSLAVDSVQIILEPVMDLPDPVLDAKTALLHSERDQLIHLLHLLDWQKDLAKNRIKAINEELGVQPDPPLKGNVVDFQRREAA